jgi:gamma-glutamyltranspeptidase / glutathione hydrolase
VIRRALLRLAVGALAFAGVELHADDRPSPQTAPRQMVSAASPLAVEAGLAMLEAGGNAVDAAVAVAMVLGFVEAPEIGIGGGGFLLWRDGRSGEIVVHDGRETAPAVAAPERFSLFGRPVPIWVAVPTGRAVGVPGLVAMLGQAHRDHGVLPWAELLQPAIELAEAGVPMPPRLREQVAETPTLAWFVDTRRFFRQQAAARPPRLRNPELAQTLRVLADQGPGALYRGTPADAIVQRAGGRALWASDMTLEDLARYQARIREPVCAAYRQWQVCGPPPPSSGGVTVLQILGMLEHFPIGGLDPQGADAIHLIAEASRLAFADRERYIGDPDFAEVPVEGLLDPAYLAARATLIRRDRAMTEVAPGDPHRPPRGGSNEAGSAWSGQEPLTIGAVSPGRFLRDRKSVRSGGTSHFSIVDGEGNAVALTGSIEAPFGARRMAGGFLLNNQLTDFSFRPDLGDHAHPNAVAGGKRPRSSMAPMIVVDAQGRTRLVIGARGGSRIIGYVARTMMAVLDWGMSVEEAVALPHYLHRGEHLELESGTPLAARRTDLEALGHSVREYRLTSGLHGVEWVDGRLRGAADPRLDGVARGH